MTGEERKALAFVAILLGLSALARAVNRPKPVIVTGASAVSIEQRLAENQQVRERVSKPPRAPARAPASPRKPPSPAPAWRTAGTGVVIDNRPPKSTAAEPLNLNRATVAELDALPGISPAVAQRIVEFRTSRGSFSSFEQLDSVKGIGPKLMDKLRPLIRLH
jgi:competence protein ComEA